MYHDVIFWIAFGHLFPALAIATILFVKKYELKLESPVQSVLNLNIVSWDLCYPRQS